jgi:hypothetical protein
MSGNDTLLAHFYVKQEKRIVDPVCFFNFNLLSLDRCWQIKGTAGHGLKVGRHRNKESRVTVLNCWLVNDEFIKSLRRYYQNQNSFTKFRSAIIISKKQLEKETDSVVDVQPYRGQRVTAETGWIYDVASRRFGPLAPFNMCKVVRARIARESLTGEAIARLAPETIVGMLVQHGKKRAIEAQLRKKDMAHVSIFTI